MSDALAILGWDKIVQKLASFAETDMGRESSLGTRPHPDLAWLADEQAAVRECGVWLESGLATTAGAAPLLELLDRVAKQGTLAPMELVGIRRTIEVYRVLAEVADPDSYPLIYDQVASEPWPRTLAEAIDHALDGDGLVRDQASALLGDIRRRIRQVEREIDDVFDRILRSGEWSKYLQDGLVTVRYGRRVVPVKNEFRHNVSGIVHDQSGSGQTVFVEPLAVVERQNRLTGLHQDEAREIERILSHLTSLVAQMSDSLTRIHYHLAWFDTHMARARYGFSLEATLPHIGGTRLELIMARHPLLTAPVPISLQLSHTRPAVIITGPNTGGKTVAIKTAGLMVSMALAGLMIPAQDGSLVPVYRQVMVDIGDEQSLEQNLSTFSSHLARLAPMMAEAGPESLCLIDEIGAGTDPEEGAALAEVMVQHLVERGAALIASTHYSRLKLMALNDPRIQNALVEFDRETLSPTYHLVMGSPGGSHALYIARRLGLPPDLVDRAEHLLDPAQVTLSDAILAINQLQQELRIKEEALRTEQSILEHQKMLLAEREAAVAGRMERDRDRALKTWRRELDEMKDKFNDALEAVRREEGRDRARAVEMLRAQYRGVVEVPQYLAARQVAGTPPQAVGESVRVAGFPDVGRITEITGKTATVEVGSLRMKLALDELERVADPPPVSKPGPRQRAHHRDLGQEKSRTLGLEVDLRGMNQEEALEVLDKYLDDAVLAGAPFVRIIHGKGTGVLRRAVSQAIKRDARVVRSRLGDPGEGGDGVTVAFLEDTD